MICQTCREDKPEDDYYRNERRCKSCCVKRALEGKRRRMWGVSGEDYERMKAAQGGRCAVCRGRSGAKRDLAVDHNHETGKVRELLCTKCNTALGHLDEDIARMEALIAYTLRHNELVSA